MARTCPILARELYCWEKGKRMSKLCLGTFLKSIIKCKRKSKTITQKNIVGEVMHIIDPDFDETDDSMISNIVAGKKNPSNYVMDNINDLRTESYGDFVKEFKSVISLLDPNRVEELKLLLCYIIENDNEIKNDTVVDIIGNGIKAKLRDEENSLEEFLAGIYIYVLKYTDNRDSNKFVKELEKVTKEQISERPVTSEFPKKNSNEKIKKQSDEEDEDILLEAQRFCIKYESEIDLLPLCQIAYNVDPTHKNVRQMYTDYVLSPTKVKKKIHQLKEMPFLTFRDGWIDDVVEKYDKQILEMGLASRSFLYEGAKYFHRAYRYYSDCEIVEFDPYIFDTLFKSDGFVGKYFEKHGNSISSYIGDYLWYKRNEPENELVNPMDYLWERRQLGSCPEPEMTYWVCLFIILTCYALMGDTVPIDEFWENVEIKTDNIKTQEDMYYFALLQLYEVYELGRK